MSLVPGSLAITAAAVASFTAAVCVSVVLVRQVLPGIPVAAQALLAALSSAALLLLEPGRDTLGFGQVNLVLMALVVLDILVLPPRWRGTLLGLAIAVKVTPAIFLLLFLTNRDWKAAARTIAVAAGVTLVAAATIPGQALGFFSGQLTNAQRVGDPGYVSNQSLYGFLTRLNGGQTSLAEVALLGLAVLTAGLVTTYLMRGKSPPLCSWQLFP